MSNTSTARTARANVSDVAPPRRATLAELTAPPVDEIDTEDVRLANGTIIRVRQISRAEYLHAAKMVDENGKVDPIGFERRILAAGIDDPPMREHDVAGWQKRPGAGGDVQAVLDKIMKWSGFREAAAKSGV